ncbi:MAG: YceI family protein [Oscillochloridaceae bacterium umkhey_bin13]
MRYRLIMLALLASLLAACGTTAPAGQPAAAEPVADPYGGASAAPAVAPTTVPATSAAPDAASPAATTAPATSTGDYGGNPSAAEPVTSPAASSAVTIFKIVPSESQVSYEVGETFFNQNNRFVVAVGTTQTLEGEVRLDRDAPQQSTVGPITIDISAFRSDSPRRDQAIRDRWLESARFPLAIFTPTDIVGLPTSYTDGEELTLTITGDLQIREVSQPTTFTVTGQVNGDEMMGLATTQIKMSDFGFSPPNIAGVLGAEDDVKITFQFVARP